MVFDGKKYSLQSIPSGIFNPRTVNVMANGMVVNPVSVIAELDRLHYQQGVTDYQLFISNRAAMVMPRHSALDGAYENMKGESLIGDQEGHRSRLFRQIQPCGSAYGRPAGALSISLKRLKAALDVKNRELKMLGLPEFDFKEVYDQYMEIAGKIGHMITDTSKLINDTLLTDAKVLFEGRAGHDAVYRPRHVPLRHIFHSFGGKCVPVGAGISPKWIDNVLGVAKGILHPRG